MTLATKKRSTNGRVSLIFHEAVHVWQRVREEMGETSPSTEFEAYAIQHIGLQLLMAYDQTRGPKRKPKAGKGK